MRPGRPAAVVRLCWPPRLPRSLSARLALSALAITAAWVLLLTVAFDIALSVRLRSNADDVLRSRAEAVLTTVDVRADGALTVRDPANDDAIDTGVWVFAGTQVIIRPAGEHESEQQARSLVQAGERFRSTSEPRAERFYALPVRSADRQVGTIVTSLALDPYRRTEDLVQVASAALGVLLLLGMYVATRANIARALRPVGQMSRQAAAWSAGDVDRRFGATGRPQELEQLAETLDGVLDRLSAVLRHEQQLTAELSHELRTPLTRIMGEAELALRVDRPPEQVRAALAAVLAGAESMQRILATLLTTARSTAGPPGRCNVAVVLRGLLDGVDAPPELELGLSGRADVWVGVAADVLERTVSPLLDNAVRYARASIRLEVGERADVVGIRVLDDGPGLAPEVSDDPFAPGRRSEDGHGGAGLGLALALRLARSSGGDLVLCAGATGACFEVSLPRG